MIKYFCWNSDGRLLTYSKEQDSRDAAATKNDSFGNKTFLGTALGGGERQPDENSTVIVKVQKFADKPKWSHNYHPPIWKAWAGVAGEQKKKPVKE